MSERPFLALCMIVKNAERTLPALLDSIDGHFDDYTFVDTGSTDGTVALLKQWLDEHVPSLFGGGTKRNTGLTRATIDEIEWTDDFAAARNYAFTQTNATWRMFLDADDVLVNGKHLRATLEDLAQRRPTLNAVSMYYDYAPGETAHEKIRLVKWLDDKGEPLGWRWTDEIHEFLELPGKQRIFATFEHDLPTDIYVHHDKNEAEKLDAYHRNIRILKKVYDDPNTPPDKRSRFAFHMANALRSTNQTPVDEVMRLFSQVARDYKGTTFGAYAMFESAKLAVDNKKWRAAKETLSAALFEYPQFRMGHLVQGLYYAKQKHFGQAAQSFLRAYEMQDPPNAPAPYDDQFFESEARVYAAYAIALVTGDYKKPEELLAKVSGQALHSNRRIHEVYNEAQSLSKQLLGMQRLKDFVDYLVWDTEASKAKALLANATPAAISNTPGVKALYDDLEKKTQHLTSWEEYKKHYASIPDNDFHTRPDYREGVLKLARVQNAIAWAKRLGDEGKPVRLVSIGVQDGIIETAMMRACKRLHLTAVDVAPQANQGIAELQANFPGRVETHAMVEHHYDWFPKDTNLYYDAVMMFEVIEHVPDDVSALNQIHNHLKEGGTLLLSTPIARMWVEPYLTDPVKGPSWYGHVRAHNPVTLVHTLMGSLFGVERLTEEYDGTFFVEAKARNTNFKHIGIYVPGTPKPFNAFSHEKGFVGGSEEAVIHLSKALADLGYVVTIFSPEELLPEYPIWRAHANVHWLPLQEAVPEWDAPILYWRCPELVPPRDKRAHPAILWLHDAFYGAPVEQYNNADEIIVLSKAHEKSLLDHDGVRATRILSNGIDENAFIGEPPERDFGKVIYASSPDRGLARLLEAWPYVQTFAHGVQPTLDVYYDWTQFEEKFPDDAAALRAAMFEYPSVTFHGGVSHPELHTALRKASVWAYPNEGEVETSCITAMKAMAAGCIPVYTKAGALEETTGGFGTPVDEFEPMSFAKAILSRLNTDEETRDFLKRSALDRFSWKEVAKRFAEVIFDDEGRE